VTRSFLSGSALLCALAVELALAGPRLSQTFDEANHLFAGYRYWRCRDFGINPEHPPLAKLLAGAPLLSFRLREPDTPCGESTTTTAEDFAEAREFLYRNDADRLLFAARMSVATLALLAGALVFAWSFRLGGARAALLGLAFFAFEPTIVAHSALVTTDMAVSCFLLAAVWAWEKAPQSSLYLALTGLFAGLCIASKHSGVLVLPLLVILAPFYFKGRRRTLSIGASLVAVAALSTVVLWATYGFRFDPRGPGQRMSVSLARYIERSTEMSGVAPRSLQVVQALDRARVLPESYLYGAANVLIGSASGGHTFLFGRLYPTGVWFYFPCALLVKWTLGFTGMLVLALFGIRTALPRVVLVLLPPTAYLLVTMTSHMNIGVRHVLPMFPFLCVFVGVQGAALLEKRAVLVYALLACHAFSSLRAFPDFLAYSNELFGGPEGTYRVLSDSNADWGQGLKEARAYLETKGHSECALAYFGTAPPEYYKLPCRALPGSPGRPAANVERRLEGTVLVSAGLLAGIPSGPGALNPFEPFQAVAPKAVIGGSLLAFEGRFDVPLLAALSHEEKARVFLDEGRFEAAVREAEEAVALAPEDPFARRALGRALEKSGSLQEARGALEAARRLAQAHAPEFHPRLLRSLDEP
jgi:hypothetical protein